MKKIFMICGVIIAVIVAFLSLADMIREYNNSYPYIGWFSTFAIWAHVDFFPKILTYGIPIGIFALLHFFMMHTSSKDLENFEPSAVTAFSAMIGFGLMYFFGGIAGYSLGLLARIPNWKWDDDFFFGFFSIIAIIPYVLSFLIVPALIAFAIVVSIYTWTHALLILTTTHPAANAVERTVKSKRPDHLIEAELASIIQKRSVDDLELKRRIKELSPTRRWAATIKYKKLARDAEELRRLANAARTTAEQEDELMWDVHDLERARRKNSDRR